jgi:hypothetical protein
LGLLTPPYLAEGGFVRLMADARMFGVELRKRLDGAIRQLVLPPLGLELGRWAQSQRRDLADDAQRRELEAAALTFVFRALFLLYAESAGYLPMARDAYARGSLTQIVQDAWEQRDRLDARSTRFWDQTKTLVRAMRNGDDALGVPPYNGDLFAPQGFHGSEVLELAELPDSALGPALVALGVEPDTGGGYDFSGLDIGHLGHIYEGLLSLRLSVADRDYRYDARRDRYVPAEPGDTDVVSAGDLLWLTDEAAARAVASTTHRSRSFGISSDAAFSRPSSGTWKRSLPWFGMIPPPQRASSSRFVCSIRRAGARTSSSPWSTSSRTASHAFWPTTRCRESRKNSTICAPARERHTASASTTWLCSRGSCFAVASTASTCRRWAPRSPRSPSGSRPLCLASRSPTSTTTSASATR